MLTSGTTVGKTYEELLEGMEITWNTFTGELPKLFDIIPAENRKIISVDWQPLGRLWLEASEKSNPSGNPLGFQPDQKGTYLAWAEIINWSGDKYNDVVYDWIKTTTWKIGNATQEAGLYNDFKYMGDSASFQIIYNGYSDDNQKRLLSISRKYDRLSLLHTLWPSSFKLGS